MKTAPMMLAAAAGLLLLAGCVGGGGGPSIATDHSTACMFEVNPPGSYVWSDRDSEVKPGGGGTAEGAAAMNACIRRKAAAAGGTGLAAAPTQRSEVVRSGGTVVETYTYGRPPAPAATTATPARPARERRRSARCGRARQGAAGRTAWRAVLLAALAGLAACGPMTVQQAERECFDRARVAQQPRGQIGIGARSDGKAVGNLDLTISSDWLTGKDPSAVYETCVMSKSGEAPRRPLYDRPDWKG